MHSSLKIENFRSGKKAQGILVCISKHFHEAGAEIFHFKPYIFLSQHAYWGRFCMTAEKLFGKQVVYQGDGENDYADNYKNNQHSYSHVF